ncbi:uncharacterized protein LOC144578777 isoform X6 [Callithrix jacchus]
MQTHSFGKFKSLKEGQKASEGRARTYTQGANWEPYGHAPLLSSLLRAEPGLKPQGPNSEPSSPRSPLPVILQMCPLWSWSGHTAASIVLLSRGNRASCDTPRPEVHPVAKPTLPQGSGHHQARPLPGGGAASRWSPEADATEQEVPGLPGWLQPAVAWPDSVTCKFSVQCCITSLSVCPPLCPAHYWAEQAHGPLWLRSVYPDNLLHLQLLHVITSAESFC